jgi:hypothetical protein
VGSISFVTRNQSERRSLDRSTLRYRLPEFVSA